ncbi:peptidoglycan DD-metalloendopeptidase family protein [Candidatus Woesearchaeota archaeon]|jgi:peptidoglycan LD-endopeptidase LytH|nr:peptidoglycan DD-metalloendopeptidase family protein [Candidatus Woesearchaeota archaeon]
MIQELLNKNRDLFGPVLRNQNNNPKFFIFDLTSTNKELDTVDMSNAEEFTKYIFSKLPDYDFGIGQYNEERIIYDHSKVFSGTNRRTIHLGIDLFSNAGVEVICPFEGTVHSFSNNSSDGDYGPTIILEHELEGIKFYTLYGHLSLRSLDPLVEGMKICKGDVVGRLGNYPENGNWPPHLHFQVIADIGNYRGDFPGVASSENRNDMLNTCPDPNLILNLF